MSDACPFGLCEGDGFVYDEAANAATDCRCRAQRVARAKARTLSGVVPKRYRGVGFDRSPVTDMDPRVVSAVKRYVRDIDAALDEGRGLWFTGDVGTGKTTLAMLVSRAALDAGRSVAIYSLPRLLSELRKTFDEGAERSYLGLIDRLTEVDLLHIDDVGAERTSEWVLEQLYAIVNGRYEQERAIVATTNLRPEEMADQVGERTVSRLIEICGDPLPLFGPDARREYRLPGDTPQARAS